MVWESFSSEGGLDRWCVETVTEDEYQDSCGGSWLPWWNYSSPFRIAQEAERVSLTPSTLSIPFVSQTLY